MSFVRALLLVVGVGVLAGCATLPPPSVSVEDLSRYRIASVQVRGYEAIQSWPAIQDAYFKSHNIPNAEQVRIGKAPMSKEAPLVAYAGEAVRAVLAEKLPAGTADVLRGNIPVTATVTLTQFDVPSAMRRVMLGGAGVMSATVTLTRADGTVVLAGPDMGAIVPLAGGIAGVVVTAAADNMAGNDELGRRVIENYVLAFNNWLRKR